MTVHSHYYEIAADTPYEMGKALGEAFGKPLLPFIQALPVFPAEIKSYLDDCFALTRELFPDYAVEIEGYAAGAGVPKESLWQILLEDDTETFSHGKCTTLVTNNGRLIAHNEDWYPAGAARIFILRRTLAGQTTFELHYAGTLGGNALSINSKGIVQTINSLDATPMDTLKPRVPTNITGRLMADSADIQSTAEKLRNMPRMRGYAHNLVDAREKKAFLIENAQQALALHEITEFPAAHANHYVLQEMLRFNRQPPDYFNRSSLRRSYAQTNATENMSVEEVKSLLEDKTAGPVFSVCNARTIASTAIDLDKACAWIRMTKEPEKGWVKYNLDFLS